MSLFTSYALIVAHTNLQRRSRTGNDVWRRLTGLVGDLAANTVASREHVSTNRSQLLSWEARLDTQSINDTVYCNVIVPSIPRTSMFS